MTLSSSDFLAKKYAEEYSSINDFRSKSPDIFHAAEKSGLIEKITKYINQKSLKNQSHEPQSSIPKRNIRRKESLNSCQWNYETVQAESLKYKKRSHFKSKSRSAHYYAVKHNILDQVCSHMDPPAKNGYSKKQIESTTNAQ